ncbi:MAG TPA: hypothetical protein HPP66_12325 [Planctomycetes bacterium]|nr:hypothetical protein [Planctomycetota bacterium]
MNLSKCKIIELPKITDVRGSLTFIEQNNHVPFEIKRVYYLYDVPGGETRGGHAHKQLQIRTKHWTLFRQIYEMEVLCAS